MAHDLLLRRSELTGRVFAITSWTEHDDGTIEALHKTDVTDEFTALMSPEGVSVLVDRSTLAHLVTTHERLSAATGCDHLDKARSALLWTPGGDDV